MPKKAPDGKVKEAIEKMGGELAQKNALQLCRVELGHEQGSLVLRFILQKTGGVTIGDCENFARSISRLLDQADLLKENYYLEVASPGIAQEVEKE